MFLTKLNSSYFESALRILDSLDSEHINTRVEPVHEQRPEGGPVGDTVLLQVSSGPTNNPLILLGDLLQTPLKLGEVTEGGGSICISKQEILSSATQEITQDQRSHHHHQQCEQCWCILLCSQYGVVTLD